MVVETLHLQWKAKKRSAGVETLNKRCKCNSAYLLSFRVTSLVN